MATNNFFPVLYCVPTLYLIIKNVILNIASSINSIFWNLTKWWHCPEWDFNMLVWLEAIRAISNGRQSLVAILFKVLFKLILHLTNVTICIWPHQWQHKIVKHHFIGIKCFGFGIIVWSCIIVLLYYFHLNSVTAAANILGILQNQQEWVFQLSGYILTVIRLSHIL